MVVVLAWTITRAPLLELDCVTLELQSKLEEVSGSLLELGVTVISMVNRLWNISDHGIESPSMVTDVVVDRVGTVEGWNDTHNLLPFGAWHEKFPFGLLSDAGCALQCLQNRVIVLEEWAASIVSGSTSNPVARCREKNWTSGRGLDIPWSPRGCQTWHWVWL